MGVVAGRRFPTATRGAHNLTEDRLDFSRPSKSKTVGNRQGRKTSRSKKKGNLHGGKNQNGKKLQTIKGMKRFEGSSHRLKKAFIFFQQ